MWCLFSRLLPQEKRAIGFGRDIPQNRKSCWSGEGRVDLPSGQGLGQPLGVGCHAGCAGNAASAPRRGGRTRYFHPKSNACPNPARKEPVPWRTGRESHPPRRHASLRRPSPLPPPLLTGGHEDDPPPPIALNAPRNLAALRSPPALGSVRRV